MAGATAVHRFVYEMACQTGAPKQNINQRRLITMILQISRPRSALCRRFPALLPRGSRGKRSHPNDGKIYSIASIDTRIQATCWPHQNSETFEHCICYHLVTLRSRRIADPPESTSTLHPRCTGCSASQVLDLAAREPGRVPARLPVLRRCAPVWPALRALARGDGAQRVTSL